MAFAEKVITARFDLANGVFEDGKNSATLSGLRMSCHIANVGGPDQAQMELAIFGMPLSIAQRLTNVGADYLKSYQNGITVMAGDAGSLSLVFTGVIFSAFLDVQDPPNVAFRVQASPGSFNKVAPAPSFSLKGSLNVASAMQSLAGQMGLSFENAGVTGFLQSRYFSGSAWDQASAIAAAAGIVWMIDRGTMIIAPPGTARSGAPVLLSPSTGLVGYPAFSESQILAKSLFNPEIKFQGLVKIESSLQPACGTWLVGAIEFDLECLTPEGDWFETLHLYTQGETTP